MGTPVQATRRARTPPRRSARERPCQNLAEPGSSGDEATPSSVYAGSSCADEDDEGNAAAYQSDNDSEEEQEEPGRGGHLKLQIVLDSEAEGADDFAPDPPRWIFAQLLQAWAACSVVAVLEPFCHSRYSSPSLL